MGMWAGAWRSLGVVVDVDPGSLPPDHSLVDDAVLDVLLQDVLGFFFSYASYGGYLIWWRDDVAPQARS